MEFESPCHLPNIVTVITANLLRYEYDNLNCIRSLFQTIHPIETYSEDVNLIKLSQDADQWWEIINMLINCKTSQIQSVLQLTEQL